MSPAPRAASLTPIAAGDHRLSGARPTPDLAALGWTEEEHRASGVAEHPHGGSADFAVRILVRRPPTERASGTLVVEWLNVSSGREAAPEWTYLAEEIVRAGHAYAAVSAQYVGVEGGRGSVAVEGMPPAGGLVGDDPERYGDLTHPGDAYCHDVFASCAAGVRDLVGADTVLAAGESQSACLLSRHLVSHHADHRVFGGYLVHSRAGSLPAEVPDGPQHEMAAVLAEPPSYLPDALGVPVVVVQTETDVLGRMRSFPARQPDGPWLRTWEVAGTAHADKFQIDAFEDFLGCPTPVNRGQQVFVLRAALRALDAWARGGDAPPTAAPLEVRDGAYVVDTLGNTRGGVRTPAVDVATEVLSGFAPEGASLICQLFGSTRPVDPALLARTHPDRETYLAAYAESARAMVAAGFCVPEDLDALLADARPDPQLPDNVSVTS